MSTAAVRTAAETEVAAIMTGFSELPYQIDIAMNDSRLLAAGYAVWFGEASQYFGTHQGLMLEMPIRVTVTKRVYARNDDDKATDTLGTLYGFTDDIVRKFWTDRIDIPETVEKAELISMSEPQFVGDGRDIVSLNLNFRVRYLL